VNCPRCGAEFELEQVRKTSEGLNQFGRLEVTYEAIGKDWVKWNPTSRMFSCLKCGLRFTFKEGVLQKKMLL
jgi:predicted nucleic-acid-binding Zn-ribbon protein